jgi:serine/threonine-protein kinase RsbW
LDPQTVEINLPNRIGFERIVMGGIAAFAKGVGFSPSRIEDLKTAVAEACINAVQHGNKGKPDARVIVALSYVDGLLSISVFDEGEGLKEEPKDPDIVRIVDRIDPAVGFGVFLMKHLTDALEFRKAGNQKHEVRMQMRL